MVTDVKNDFVITRVFDAPREKVWRCFTEPERMKEWFGPKGSSVVQDGSARRRRANHHHRVEVAVQSRAGAAHAPALQADNTVEFTLDRGGDGTRVTWAMRGRSPFMAKLMGLFMNCDAMVGRQFEEGLAKLKALVETHATSEAAE